jgi:hypothetical protein
VSGYLVNALREIFRIGRGEMDPEASHEIAGSAQYSLVSVIHKRRQFTACASVLVGKPQGFGNQLKTNLDLMGDEIGIE